MALVSEWRCTISLLGLVFCLLQIASGEVNLQVLDVTYSSIRVNVSYSAESPVDSCILSANSKFDSENGQEIDVANGTSMINDLKSNIVYLLTVTCRLTTGTGLSDVAEARTYPNGISILTSRPSTHYFTAFLEVIPGATEWVLEWTDHSSPGINYNVTLEDPYKIFLNVTADTRFSLRARVSRINSTSLLQSQSPFGEVTQIQTAALSLFGRVIILGETSADVESKRESWRRGLFNEYRRFQSLVADVRILETSASTSPSGVLVHHEIYVNGTTHPPVSSLTFTNQSEYADQKVVVDVDPKFLFGIIEEPPDSRVLALFPYDQPTVCTEDKKTFRSWVLNQHSGVSSDIIVSRPPDSKEAVEYNVDATIGLNDNKLHIWSGNMDLQANTLYSIDHDYSFKTCLKTNTTVSLYGKRRRASYSSDALPINKFNSTFMYSTGPSVVDVTKISYTLSNDFDTMTVRIPSMYRAQSYEFSIRDSINSSVVTLSDLDSSAFIEASLGGYSPSKEYCLKIVVTIKHPTTFLPETDRSETCFQFYSGPPAAAVCRVVEVTENSFKVISQADFASLYVIEISNVTFSQNYTTNATHFPISDDVTVGSIYDVRVAGRNPFGNGVYSSTKSTKFWNVTDVTNASIALIWDKEPLDDSYKVDSNAANNTPQVTDNSAILSGLTAGVVYSVNVSVVTNLERILLFSIKQITVPGTPTLEAQTVLPHELVITWADLSGVDEYVLNISGRGNIQQHSIRNRRPARFFYLYSGVRYTITAAFHNSAGFALTEKQFVTGLAIPSNISVMTATSQSIEISWDEIAGALSYQVVAYVGNNSIDAVTVYEEVATLSNMNPGQNYSITVSVAYDEGNSSLDPFTARTAPANPDNLRQTGNFPNSIWVSWNEVESADYYIVQVTGGVRFPLSSTSTTVDNLRPNSGYDIIVTAVNSGGRSQPVKKRLFTEFLRPTGIEATEITSESLSLSWKTVLGARFQLRWRSGVSNSATSEFSVDAVEDITDLLPETEYHISIKAIYLEGESDFTDEVTFTTLPPSTSSQSSLPWWVFVIAAMVFVLALGGIAVCVRYTIIMSRQRQDATGFYDFQQGDQTAILDIVALEDVTLQRIADDETAESKESEADDKSISGSYTVNGAYVGLQPSVPTDETPDALDEGAEKDRTFAADGDESEVDGEEGEVIKTDEVDKPVDETINDIQNESDDLKGFDEKSGNS